MVIEEGDWQTLLARIKSGDCTPFLGAAVNYNILPLGGEIAETLAAEFSYPLENKADLPKVTQFVAIATDAMRPKELVIEKLQKLRKPFNFNDDAEPLNVLAKLPLPVYITTNYDDLLLEAIRHHGISAGREAFHEYCNWNTNTKRYAPKGNIKFKPSVKTPLIYHLHGHFENQDSLVLTEDDYLDFLVNMSRDISTFLPTRIQEAITGASVLFIGYSLADPDFRILFRGLLGNLEKALSRRSIAVQLPYKDADPNKQKAEDYITRYFGNMNLRVFWGTAKQFAEELWDRWKKYNG